MSKRSPKSKSDEALLLVPVPALVAVLMNKEQEKGAPLTEDEVVSIRDNASSIAMPLFAKLKVQEERGYVDIDPERAWVEWQLARQEVRPTAVLTTQGLADFLGGSVGALLAHAPFDAWAFNTSLREEGKKRLVDYVFPEKGLGLICDGKGAILTMFLSCDEQEQFDGDLSDLPFASTRQEVIDRLGPPSKSGAPMNDPILGAYGGWTRFARPGHSIHVEYRVGADRVKMITLMREDVVP